MASDSLSITNLESWKQLLAHRSEMENFSILQSFSDNPERTSQFNLESDQITLDFSKHLINQKTLTLLHQLASERNLEGYIAELQTSANHNNTENRPALHWLLRQSNVEHLPEELQALHQSVIETKEKIQTISNEVYQGLRRGYTGKPFTDIVHIGIGGSDLGPAMVYQALTPYHREGIQCHYISNVCGHDIDETLSKLDPHSTLFIVASKSFTTLETLTNANTAKSWLLSKLLDDESIAFHFYAVSSKPERAKSWGINAENILPFADWVGGRYSVWSAIGLSLSIGLGHENFEGFLQGAETMDKHFFEAEQTSNLPVILALLDVWYINFWQRQAHVIVPYDHRLRRFAAYLQQLEMESTGKSTTRDNRAVDYDTCPDIWGEPGSNSQHSFFQQLHQGTEFTPVDFIAVLKPHHAHREHHDWLLANCFAQSRALMLGQTEDADLGRHKFMPGNRPSSTLVIQQLTPAAIGSLMALYEHKVYVQSVLWDVNPFDQWGVELGKSISQNIKAVMDGEEKQLDPSTESLIELYLQSK